MDTHSIVGLAIGVVISLGAAALTIGVLKKSPDDEIMVNLAFTGTLLFFGLIIVCTSLGISVA